MKVKISQYATLLLSLSMTGQVWGGTWDWLNSPSLRAWQDAVRLAGVPAQNAKIPAWVDSMAVCTTSPMAHTLVLEGLTHLITFEDVLAYEKFSMALRLDPNCLLAHCGLSMSLLTEGAEFLPHRIASLQAIHKLAQSSTCLPKEKAYADMVLAAIGKDGGVRAAASCAKKICEEWKQDPYAPLFYALMIRADGGETNGEKQRNQQVKAIIASHLEQHPESAASLFLSTYLDSAETHISDATLAKAEKLVSIHTGSASSFHLLGHCQFRRGDYKSAAQSFQVAEKLALQQEKKFGITRARNVAWFKAVGYRAVTEFCAGNYDAADKIAATVVRVRVDGKYPQSAGALFQMWEGRTIQLRLLLARPTLPDQVLILKANPAPLPKECSELPGAVQTMCHFYQTAYYEKKHGNSLAPLTQFEKMEELVRLLYQEICRNKQINAAYSVRALRLGAIYGAEMRALGFPDSADLWLEELILNQEYENFLLPPIVPYPLEWKLAQHYLSTKQYQKSIDACIQGLKRFPNHSGVLATMEKAQNLLKKQPQT